MPELMDIRDFIQKIAQGITFAIGIDTQVIDSNLQRVAGKQGSMQSALPWTGQALHA